MLSAHETIPELLRSWRNIIAMKMRHTNLGGCSNSAPHQHIHAPVSRAVSQCKINATNVVRASHQTCSLRKDSGSCQSCSAPCSHGTSPRSLMLRPLRVTNTNQVWASFFDCLSSHGLGLLLIMNQDVDHTCLEDTQGKFGIASRAHRITSVTLC